MSCLHDWQPVQGWYARYRCALCRVIGYKPAALHPEHCHRTETVPYRCQATSGGKRCPEPAVHALRGKRFKCAAHVCRGKRTAEARTVLVGHGAPAPVTDSASNAIDPESNGTEPESMRTDRESSPVDSGATATDARSIRVDSGSVETDAVSNPTDSGSV